MKWKNVVESHNSGNMMLFILDNVHNQGVYWRQSHNGDMVNTYGFVSNHCIHYTMHVQQPHTTWKKQLKPSNWQVPAPEVYKAAEWPDVKTALAETAIPGPFWVVDLDDPLKHLEPWPHARPRSDTASSNSF